MILFSIFFSGGTYLSAQQISQISGFNLVNEIYNPASIGMQYQIDAGTLVRKQWVGFTGSPFLTGGFADFTFRNKVSIAGVQYFYDQLGSFKFNQIRFIYAHKTRLTRDLSLNIALAPELILASAYNDFVAADPNDPAIPPYGLSKQGVFTFSGGITLYSSKFIVGLSINQALESKMNTLHYHLVRHYSLTMCYHITFGNNYKLAPWIVVLSDGRSTQVELMMQNEVWEKYIFGVGYRLDDALIFQAGYRLKKFTLAYTYDFTTSAIRNYSKGSHEVILRWGMNYIKRKKIIIPNLK